MLRNLLVASVVLFLAKRSCAMRDDLETDCEQSTNNTTIPLNSSSSSNSFRFRTDRLSPGECSIYARLLPSCSPVVGRHRCSETGTGQSLNHPLRRTYIVLDQGCYSAVRSVLLDVTKRIHSKSPTRALIMAITERNDAKDPIHPNVFEPIRNQLIDLVIKKCLTVTVTAKIDEVGLLPNLFKLEIQRGKNLVIEKQHFANMPNVRMISFWLTTIALMEPYICTFTDLTQLKSLLLEDGVHKHLVDVFNNEHFYETETVFSNDDIEAVQRLHCNCSFAWFRNFLKEKPYLTEEKKRGEVTTVGNYVSEAKVPPATMSVDCAKAYMNETNLIVGPEFSYNTSCYNLQC